MLPMPFLEIDWKRFYGSSEVLRNCSCFMDLTPVLIIEFLHKLDIFFKICCLFGSQFHYHMVWNCVYLMNFALELFQVLSESLHFQINLNLIPIHGNYILHISPFLTFARTSYRQRATFYRSRVICELDYSSGFYIFLRLGHLSTHLCLGLLDVVFYEFFILG